MATATLLDVITLALGSYNEVGFGQTASAEDGQLGLDQSNLIVEELSLQRLYLPYVAIRTYPLTALTANYDLGPTAAPPFNVTRPTFIESAQINVVGSNVWLPLNIIDKGQWDAIRNKGSAADVPEDMYPQYSFPNMVLYFNPAPFGTPNVRLGAWEALAQFASITDPFPFPIGYKRLFVALLAVAMGPFYGKSVTKETADLAAGASSAIMKLNAQGLGGSLGESQKLVSPNVGGPMPSGGA